MRAEQFDRLWYRFAEQTLPEACTYRNAVDLGGGRGEFSRLLRDSGFNVRVLDLDPYNASACQALGLETALADFNQPLPFKDDSFDLAVVLEVIEHVPLADNLLREISRILRRDGLLLLSTPNCAWILRRLQSLWGYPPPAEGYHFRFFVRRSLTNLLRLTGFEVVRRNSWTHPFPMLNRLRRWLGQPRTDWHVPAWAESLWAFSFIWLARNTKDCQQKPRKMWERPLRV